MCLHFEWSLSLPLFGAWSLITRFIISCFKLNVNRYLEISFTEAYMIDAGTLNVQVRWNQEDWSSYTNFKEGNVEVYYDGQLIK